VTKETKPAVKTTEFWTMLFGNLLGVVQLVAGPVNVSDNRIGLAMSIITGAYMASRGLAKQGIPYTES
jgi:hypothetical protein